MLEAFIIGLILGVGLGACCASVVFVIRTKTHSSDDFFSPLSYRDRDKKEPW